MNPTVERRLCDAEQAIVAAAGRPVVIELLPGESQQAAIRRAGAEHAPAVILLYRTQEPYPDVA